MPVREIDSSRSKELKRFIGLERKLLGSEPLYVSESDPDVRKRLKGRSAFHDEIEHALFVASNGADVARCAAMLNRRYQRDKGEQVGFIGYLSADRGAQAEVREMLARAEDWLRERHATRVIAPFNGAGVIGLGVLSDAFDEQPIFPLAWHPPYYLEYLEAASYRPTYPFWVYEVDLSSERYRTVARAALDDARCEVRPMDKKRWKEDLEVLLHLFNEGFRDEWEFHRYTLDEFNELFGPMKPVLDPRQLLIAEVEGEPAGLCFGMPDWTPLFRSFRGRMGPLQIYRLLTGARRYERAGLLAIAVLPSQRGKHIGQTLAATLYGRYEELGLKRAFYYLVNDVNLASRRLAESFGGTGRVIYRCYDKVL